MLDEAMVYLEKRQVRAQPHMGSARFNCNILYLDSKSGFTNNR